MLECNLLASHKSPIRGRLYLKQSLSLPNASATDYSPWFDYTGIDDPIDFTSATAQGFPKFAKGTGIPQTLLPGDANDFVLTARFTLLNQNTCELFGNLINGNGTGSFWITLNNTYIASSLLSIDGYDTSGNIWRARFGSGKLTMNAPHLLSIERKSGMLKVSLDGVTYPSVAMPKGFALTYGYPLAIGATADAALKLTGKVEQFDYTVYR